MVRPLADLEGMEPQPCRSLPKAEDVWCAEMRTVGTNLMDKFRERRRGAPATA
jgi:hypothetical protein